jgi:hypothetical protein
VINNAQDIEIYLAQTDCDTCIEWLQQHLDAITTRKKTKGMPKKAQAFTAHWNDRVFLILIYEQVVPGYTSIWLDSPDLPWDGDESCARQAAHELNTSARITAGGWQQSDDPDAWLEITADGNSQQVIWKTE